MYKTTIENCDIEIDIGIEFDYQPYEPMERHYPGCPESVEINYVSLLDENGKEVSEICLLNESEFEETILEWVAEEADYEKYGYMMD